MNRTHFIYFTALLLLVGVATTNAQTIRGNIYGGGEIAQVEGNAKVEVYTGTIGDGTAFDGGVFGGGLGQQTVVTQNVEVIIGKEGADRNATGATINGDVYGGSALGNTNCSAELAPTENAKTDVTLNAGVINGSMYGGALGQKNGVNDATSDIAANVYGPVQVDVYGGVVMRRDGDKGTDGNEGGEYSGGIYGCNNLNGSPQTTVGVDIYHHKTAKTVEEEKYTLFAVYGGGNQADYIGGTPNVTVHYCDNSIKYVYGGGNAAHLTHETAGVGDGNTNVTIWGCELIGNVFGGGNGQVQAANVSGNTSVTIHGGKIINVFGGSNTNGMIGGATNVTVSAQDEDPDNTCNAMDVANVYGGGNRAAGKSGTINIACTGAGKIENVYGGANEADLTGDITLNITGGQITNVFGGNNNSGNINGAITVNVDWATGDDACGTNSLTNVYGGGNLAPYSVYGYNDDGSCKESGEKLHNEPTVNIYNATINNNVYGGGLGAAAIVYGNPIVKIGDTNEGAETKTANILGDVYGGGDAAAVAGTPQVRIPAKNNTTIANVYGGGNAADVNGTDLLIDGGHITGMVFGGGHGNKDAVDNEGNPSPVAANVEGNVQLYVTGGTINKVFAGSNSMGNIAGTVDFQIAKGNNSNEMHISEVYGGGNLAAGNAGTILIGCTGGDTEGIGDVYGGANAADINSDITLTITGGRINNVFGGNNTSGDINGNIEVNVEWSGACSNSQINNVYGGGNLAQYTTPEGHTGPTVNIKNGTISQNVYGGGKGDAADHTKGQITGTPIVNIGSVKTGLGDGETDTWIAHVIGDVYGGGDAGDVIGTPQVNIINKCSTIIDQDVYGGGNAADVRGTDVNIDGGVITGMVFGGGHGNKDAVDDDGNSAPTEANVSGDVNVDITGGTIGKVFAGSNSKGSITGTMNLNINKEDGHCDMKIAEVYGGGNLAAGKAGNITIGCTGDFENNGEGIGDVYGGANAADISNAIELTINGGHINRVFGGNNASGNITGPITVNVDWNDALTCGKYLGNVFGGGNLAGYQAATTVNLKKGTVNNIYGGGNEAGVGSATVNMSGGNVLQGLYGGCNTSGTVTGDIAVTVTNGNIGTDAEHKANVHGGGYGASTATGGNVTVNIAQATEKNVTIYGDIYGGSALGNVNDNTNDNTLVTITDGTINGNVYGGGLGNADNAAQVNGGVAVSIDGGTVNGNVYGCNNTNGTPSGTVTVDVTGGTISNNVFGGGNLANATVNPVVTITGGTVTHDVYGGGALADITGYTTVNLFGGAVGGAYGGGLGAKTGVNGATTDVAAIVTGNTTVTLGKKQDDGTYTASQVTETGIFGANNINGTPQGHAFVHVIKTTPRDGQTTGQYDVPTVYGGGNKAAYEPSQATSDAGQGFAEVLIENCDNSIQDVYGGGNAAPVPATDVQIYGGTIDRVFAGGNGLGTSLDPADPGYNKGADVGWLGFRSTGSTREYGSGLAQATIYGGTINQVFGGSNTLGYIRVNTSVSVKEYEGIDHEVCELNVKNVYGAGNNAPIECPIDICLDCSEGADIIYAGANNADVQDINLVIASGTYGQVFGGNNAGGAVKGKIIVTIDEKGCTPVIIKELYACGNMADYSVYGYEVDGDGKTQHRDLYTCDVCGHESATEFTTCSECSGTAITHTKPVVLKTSGDRLYQDPVINVISCTAIGSIFGGGYKAAVYGDPHVNVNMTTGDFSTSDKTDVAAWVYSTDGAGSTISTRQFKTGLNFYNGLKRSGNIDGLGTIGNIYGGGNLAPIYGDTYVNICKNETTAHLSRLTTDTTPVDSRAFITPNLFGIDYGTEEEAPTGSVYGGGKMANVFGNTKVHIRNGNIEGDVYGAGQGDAGQPDAALVQGKTEVIIGEDE